MTRLDQIRAAEARLLIPTYDRNPLLFVGGQGVHIIDENGTEYLDLLSGIGVNALGYSHPAIVEAVATQSHALIHTSNLYYHQGQAELALRLTERTGLDRAFFGNTGTEVSGFGNNGDIISGLLNSAIGHSGTDDFLTGLGNSGFTISGLFNSGAEISGLLNLSQLLLQQQ